LHQSNTQLRGYIPLGAPLVWEPVVGDESPLRMIASFTVNWFYKRIGVDFSKRYHTDPVYRFECLNKMKKTVQERFAHVPYFFEHDKGGFERECATISGIFGVCPVAMAYGMEPVYYKNGWPAIRPGAHLTIDEIKALQQLDLQNNPFMEQLFDQMDIIEKNWGLIDGYINFQGVLNNAFKIRGTDIFIDMLDDPGLAHYLFDHITDTMIRMIKMVQKRQRDSGFDSNHFCTSNCVVNMISADTYKEFILPQDIKLSRAFDRFGVHNCNWVVDPYIVEYAKIPGLGYLDLGFDSDLERVGAIFKNTRLEVFYDPANLLNKTEYEIKTDIGAVLRKIGPCDITLPDIDDFIPDEKINMFARIVSDIVDAY